MNRKGMTMIEIMVSIALIAIVMLFVFNILIDLRHEETLNGYKNADQINRSIITKRIQSDILERGLAKISKIACSSSSNYYCLELTYIESGYKGRISVSPHEVKYELLKGNSVEDSEKWTLNASEYAKQYKYCYYTKDTESKIFYVKLVLPVDLTDNIYESKMNFDIELLYMGQKRPETQFTPDVGGVMCGEGEG